MSNDELDTMSTKVKSSLRRQCVTMDGVILPARYREMKDEILNLETRPDDVFLCGYPKCGTTWTDEMVWCIANDLDFEGAKVPLYERCPYLELTAFTHFEKSDPEIVRLQHEDQILKYVKEFKGRRFIKTHLPFKLLPTSVQKREGRPKIIYVTRDPRDCCVSGFHFTRMMDGFEGNFDEYVKLFMNGKIWYGPFGEHVTEFWKKRNETNILFITYEEMKRDLPAVIIKVAEFLDKTLSAEQIKKLEKHLSFESMRSNRAVNLEKDI